MALLLLWAMLLLNLLLQLLFRFLLLLQALCRLAGVTRHDTKLRVCNYDNTATYTGLLRDGAMDAG
jgi:hypothetical protein